MSETVHIIGGGLAGSEAAWQLARAGVAVVIHEMRPQRMTEAHTGGGLAELVCSNSLRSDDVESSAVGLLHEEMRRAGSLVMTAADACRVPAGAALAVDREAFSHRIEEELAAQPLISITREEVVDLDRPDWHSAIVASGPLTSEPLSRAIRDKTGTEHMHFFDAIAPIVHRDSIDFSIAWMQSRYDKGDGADYINCPLDDGEYEAFIRALLEGEKIGFREWEQDTPFFEGCLPIEVMAGRGPETLAFGPMKPVGLVNPNRPGQRMRAVVQLRQDNRLGTLYNMVGFQTKLRHAEQLKIFRMIPGLQNAEFARLGGMHRNTFINSPKLLDGSLRLKSDPRLRFAGQITGCEGYVESAAIGLLAGIFAAADVNGTSREPPPTTTALGALLAHVTGGALTETYQPMNVNFGLLPPLDEKIGKNGRPIRIKGRERKKAYGERALAHLQLWLNGPGEDIMGG